MNTVLSHVRKPAVAGRFYPGDAAQLRADIVISSDLSHYHDYATARRLDRETANAIEALDVERLHSERACGCIPIRGLLDCAPRLQLRGHLLDLRNSGDTSGSRDQVVGYGAFVFEVTPLL